MKVKLLSLFLALGIFVAGTSVMAVGETKEAETGNVELGCPKIDWTKVITNYVCKVPGLGVAAPACKTWCDGLSANKAVIADAEACMTYLETNLGKYGSVVTSLVKQGCNVGCSGNAFCNTCKDATHRQRCGIVCCAIDKSTVSSCMKYNKDDCKNYLNTGSKEAF